MNAYETAAKYMAIIQRAGARHSAKDNDLVQQMHDRACELGAKCKCEEVGTHPTLRAAVEALILRHPGHPNQKVHGNRFGGYGTTKESLRRLKGDKEGRERYKASARKKAGAESKPVRTPGKMNPKGKRPGVIKASKLAEGDKFSDLKRGITTVTKVHPFDPKYPKSQIIETNFGRMDFDPDRLIYLQND